MLWAADDGCCWFITAGAVGLANMPGCGGCCGERVWFGLVGQVRGELLLLELLAGRLLARLSDNRFSGRRIELSGTLFS